MLTGSQRTFQVGDRHYALVAVEGLTPAPDAYEVRLDGERVWPPADSSLRRRRIRTPAPGRPVRLAFGSCRYASPLSVISSGRSAPTHWTRTRSSSPATPDAEWPDGLLLLGDQVYADETSPITQRRSARAGTSRSRPGYRCGLRRVRASSTASPGATRWCAGCLDRADLDDLRRPRRARRLEHVADLAPADAADLVVAGADHRRAAAYWVYQHLGNLSPAALAEDEIYRRSARPTATSADAARLRRPRPTARPTGPRVTAGATGATSARCGSSSSTPAAAGSWTTRPRDGRRRRGPLARAATVHFGR